jgi:hypothetical protein
MFITLPDRPVALGDDGLPKAPHRDLSIVAGGTGRDKAICIAGDPQQQLSVRLRAVTAAPPGP